MTKISTRKEAFERGERRYFTGRACSKGHVAERFTSTGGCVKCNSERSQAFRSNSAKASSTQERGWFGYPSHPDDFAAALAYCQSLDLTRGRTPHMPEAPRVVAEVTPERMAQMRAQALGRAFEAADDGRISERENSS